MRRCTYLIVSWLAAAFVVALNHSAAASLADEYTATPLCAAPELTPSFYELGDLIFFINKTPEQGSELWRTDGTAAGTFCVRDINPGPDGSSPEYIGAIGDFLYFRAFDPAHGFELYKTDGQLGHTSRFIDLNPGPGDGISLGWIFEGKIVFAGTTPATGQELFVTNGTSTGTTVLREFIVGPQGVGIKGFLSDSSELFLQINRPEYNQVWICDRYGVRKIISGGNMQFANLTAVGSLYLNPVFGLSYPDGSARLLTYNETTYVVELLLIVEPDSLIKAYSFDFTPGFISLKVSPADPATPPYLRLLRYDPSNSPTFSVIAEISELLSYAGIYGPRLISYKPLGSSVARLGYYRQGIDLAPYEVSGPLKILHNHIYFFGRETGSASFWSLFQTDDLYGNTFHALFNWHTSEIFNPALIGRTFYFSINSGSSIQLWAADQDKEQTELIRSDLQSTDIFTIGGRLFYVDSLSRLNLLTRTPVRPVPGFNSTLVSGDSHSPDGYLETDHYVYFTKYNETRTIAELWRTNLQPGGTLKIFSGEIDPRDSNAFRMLATSGDACYFMHNSRLWKTSGDPQPSITNVPDIDIYPYAPRALIDGQYVFVAHASDGSSILYRSDGTAPGTRIIKEFKSPGLALGRGWAIVPGEFYFMRDSYPPELWRTDGTEEGTIYLHVINDSLTGAKTFNGKTLLCFDEGVWCTDNTPSGTNQVSNIQLSGDELHFRESVIFNKKLHFVLEDLDRRDDFRDYSYHVWLTDGTTTGTQLAFPEDYWMHKPTVFGNRMFFIYGLDLYSYDGLSVSLVWKNVHDFIIYHNKIFFIAGGLYFIESNSTEPQFIRSVAAGEFSNLAIFSDRLFIFSSPGFDNTREMWISDGTPVGTTLLLDSVAGMLALNKALLFADFDLNAFAITPLPKNTAHEWTLYH